MKIIKQAGEEPLCLRSDLRGPVRALSVLRRSLLFAELSMIAYNDVLEATYAAAAIGFPSVEFFNHDGSQAFEFRNEWDCVIACRGTEPHEWNDIKVDANAAPAVAETMGRVHRGFKKEVDDLWPMLEVTLKNNVLPVWFCGHSLGGAMATICARRCQSSYISSNPEELYTFGSPRVGDKEYLNHVKLTHYRWVHNNDLVVRVPPRWLGYIHTGQEMYLDSNGELRRLFGWQRTKDRIRGFLRGLTNWSIDHFSDHSIHKYAGHIWTTVRKEEGLPEQEITEQVIEIPASPSGASASAGDKKVGGMQQVAS